MNFPGAAHRPSEAAAEAAVLGGRGVQTRLIAASS